MADALHMPRQPGLTDEKALKRANRLAGAARETISASFSALHGRFKLYHAYVGVVSLIFLPIYVNLRPLDSLYYSLCVASRLASRWLAWISRRALKSVHVQQKGARQ